MSQPDRVKKNPEKMPIPVTINPCPNKTMEIEEIIRKLKKKEEKK